MLRALSILLLFTYSISAVGVTITRHYCGGKLKAIEINKFSYDNKCCKKKAMPKDCCKRTSKLYKLDNSHAKAKVLTGLENPVKPALSFDIPKFFSPSSITKVLNVPYHAPPDGETPIFLRNQSFLI